MDDTYFHIVLNGEIIMSNLPLEYYGFLESATAATQVVMCPYRQSLRRQKKYPVDTDGFLFLCSYNPDLNKKSFALLFSSFQMLYEGFLDKIKKIRKESIDSSKSDIHRLQHNINSYNARIQDDLDSIISLEDTKLSEWSEVVKMAQNAVRSDIKKAAVVLLKTMKNISLVNAEMNVYDFLENPGGEIQLTNHQIHKIVKLSLQPFFLDFIENRITLNIHECREVVRIDYPSISVVFGHLWSNAIKYTARDTEIEIDFKVSGRFVEVIVSSFSTVIEVDEVDKIMEEGYSGKWSRAMNKSGDGIGMYYIKYLTELNHGEFRVNAGASSTKYNGIPYARNQFIVSLIRQK